MLRPSAPIPTTGWLPASFPHFMVVTLLHALPRPDARTPTAGRSRIHHVLGMVRTWARRDAFEAELVPSKAAQPSEPLQALGGMWCVHEFLRHVGVKGGRCLVFAPARALHGAGDHLCNYT